MRVDIHAAGEYIFARRVDHGVGTAGIQVSADQDNLFAINQEISHVFVGGGDNSSILDQCFHN